MNRILLSTLLCLFVVTGCGLGTSAYKDALLDGASNLNRGRTEKALADFNRAVEINPSHFDGYLGRADTLNTMGRYGDAIADYNRALEINPSLAKAYANRAIAYSHLKQYENAIADYEKALQLDPEIDDPPGFVKRLFSNEPNRERGIRKHLEYLKTQTENS